MILTQPNLCPVCEEPLLNEDDLVAGCHQECAGQTDPGTLPAGEVPQEDN